MFSVFDLVYIMWWYTSSVLFVPFNCLFIDALLVTTFTLFVLPSNLVCVDAIVDASMAERECYSFREQVHHVSVD
jgi:hypothetical protein